MENFIQDHELLQFKGNHKDEITIIVSSDNTLEDE